jgi:hypothetical protein
VLAQGLPGMAAVHPFGALERGLTSPRRPRPQGRA